MSEVKWLIRDDGKVFPYDKFLANHPRLNPYFPKEEKEEVVEEPVEEQEPREAEFCDEQLEFANKSQMASYAERVFGVRLDKRKGVETLRKQVEALQKEEG